MKVFGKILFLAFFGFVLQGVSSAESGARVSKIIVDGNKRTESSTIISYSGFKEGGTYDQNKSNEAIKKLYATGFFESVTVSSDGGTVKIQVEENPIISNIYFEGNDALKSEVLTTEMSLRKRDYFSKAKLQNDINRLTEVYKKTGRLSVKVNVKLEKLPQNRVNLMFEISEKGKTQIEKILFVGNNSFPRNALKSAIMSKEDTLFNFFKPNYYNSDLVEYDKVLLTKFYLSQGYANFKVISTVADIVPGDKDRVYLTFVVEEGVKYHIGSIKFDNNLPSLKNEDLEGLITMKTGDVFNMDIIENINAGIVKFLANKGFPFANVDADYTTDDKNRLAHVVYRISRAAKVYVRKINIGGNLKTYDFVIRREMRLSEGDPYNAFMVNRSEQRIRNLDYFETVSMNTVKTPNEDQVDLNLDVVEKSTAQLKFSAGYSTADGPLGTIGFTEKNFLGKGQRVSLDFQKTPLTLSTGFSYSEPNFLASGVETGFAGNYYTEDNSRENKLVVGGSDRRILPASVKSYTGSVFANYEISESLGHNINYSFTQEKLTKSRKDSSPQIVLEQLGTANISAVGHTLTYDVTDSAIKPTEGHIVSLSQKLAGVGGDSRYLRNLLRAAYYYPVTDDIVFKLAGDAGHIFGVSKRLRIQDNFNLGDQSFRGFEWAGMGPRDKESKISLGGTTYYKGTAEVVMPFPGVSKETDMSLALFSDFGSIWNVDLKGSKYNRSDYYDTKSIRASVGMGVIWITGMGPLRFDFAKAVKKENFDEAKLFTMSYAAAL